MMFSFATTCRSLLVLAVVAATGPWCCCSAATLLQPSSEPQMVEGHRCCSTDESSPTQTPPDPTRCDKGCDVMAIGPDIAGDAVATVSHDAGELIVAAVAYPWFAIDMVHATSKHAEPPGIALSAARSLHAQHCLLTL